MKVEILACDRCRRNTAHIVDGKLKQCASCGTVSSLGHQWVIFES